MPETYKYFQPEESTLRAIYGGGPIQNGGDSAEVAPYALTQRYIMQVSGYAKNKTNALWRIGRASVPVASSVWCRVSDNLYPSISGYLTAAEIASVTSTAPTGFSIQSDLPMFRQKIGQNTTFFIGDSLSSGVQSTAGLPDAPCARTAAAISFGSSGRRR